METTLSLAGVKVRFCSQADFAVDPPLQNFLDGTGNAADITVYITQDWEQARLPNPADYRGEDLICRYYRQGETCFCVTKGRTETPLACAVYQEKGREVHCVVNQRDFALPPENLGSYLRMIPIQHYLLHQQTLFFHASQVAVQGTSILFAAPSGTGKTTQARLWRELRGGEILSNDRSLVRKVENRWQAFGYPLDGSEPAGRNQMSPLGAVVLLRQGPVNEVRPLTPRQCVPELMEQMVLDAWNQADVAKALGLLTDLVAKVPVFRLTCTPDEGAVTALETVLREYEVICNG